MPRSSKEFFFALLRVYLVAEWSQIPFFKYLSLYLRRVVTGDRAITVTTKNTWKML